MTVTTTPPAWRHATTPPPYRGGLGAYVHALRFDTSRSGSRDQPQPISCDLRGFCVFGGTSYKRKGEIRANLKYQKKMRTKFAYMKKKLYLCIQI